MKLRLLESENSKTYHAYHGSGSKFKEFMHQFIGSHGVENGYGFYFTNRKEIAMSYGRYVIEADISLNNPFSTDNITITKEQVYQFISRYADPTGDGYLSGWGDVRSETYSRVLEKAVDALFTYNQSDSDIINEILSFVEHDYKVKDVYKGIIEIFGHDGIIYKGYDQFYGEEITNYIVYTDEQIQNKKRIDIEEA